jgi:hypothetical protein
VKKNRKACYKTVSLSESDTEPNNQAELQRADTRMSVLARNAVTAQNRVVAKLLF